MHGAEGDQRLRVLRLKQVMRRLGCSESTVRRLESAGHLPEGRRHTPDGPKVWFEADIELYLHRMYRGDFKDKPVPRIPKERKKRTE